MKTIYKYRVDNVVMVPRNAKILHLDYQAGDLCVWVAIDTKEVPIPYRFNIAGTGHAVPEGKFIGTVQQPPFVWHVYLVIEDN